MDGTVLTLLRTYGLWSTEYVDEAADEKRHVRSTWRTGLVLAKYWPRYSV